MPKIVPHTLGDIDDEPDIRTSLSHQGGNKRDFIAWDGEGISVPPGTPQPYVLFGASTGDYITSDDLSTEACLDLLLHVKRKYPNSFFVGYAIGYDGNQMLRSLDESHLWTLHRHNKVKWHGYTIERIPGKWFLVRKRGQSAKLYDVFGFFQSSFVTACEKFLGTDDPELERVRIGKQRRSDFHMDELRSEIIPYWQGELRLTVRLMDALRDDLLSANLPIRSWHGPGAVADTVFRQFNIKAAKAETPGEVNRASQYAYAGGRFELFRVGHHPDTVWEYDINSAYPTGIAELPNLQTGTWERTSQFDPDAFGVWRVQYDAPGGFFDLQYRPHPLFVRGVHGEVSYPAIAHGWYWTPEAALVPNAVTGGWVLRDDGTKPFAFVRRLYDQRLEWKRQGNSAERALKLALNSLYGKTAQRVGGTQGPPSWHQLEWAGYVTSYARAKLFRAIMLNWESVIAVETDAVFSTQPLNLETGTGLGQWEMTEFDWITYYQSGLYYAGVGDATLERYRGFDKGSLPHSVIHDYLRDYGNSFEPWRLPPPVGRTTRYIGLGYGLRTKRTWRAWETENRYAVLGGGGKRTHRDSLCRECRAHTSPAEGLHSMMVATAGGLSYPHSLPWVDGGESIIRTMEDMELDRSPSFLDSLTQLGNAAITV